MRLRRCFIGIGANLPARGFKTPLDTCCAAIETLTECGFEVTATSRWYESAPVPLSDQPWFINGVAECGVRKDASSTLTTLHQIESKFGRVRGEVNAPRVLDLDLLDFDGKISTGPAITLPHPRMHERAFVLLPMRDLAPTWAHPVLGLTIGDLIDFLTPEQEIRLYNIRDN